MVVLLLAALLAAPTTFPIQSLTVTGNQNYSREQILTVAALKVGQLAGPKDFEAARDRLAATGAFESLEFRFRATPDQKGYAVTFEVSEAGPFFPVRFDELGVADTELRAHLARTDPLFGEKIPATQALLARYAKALEGFLASKGRHEPIIGRLVSDGEPLAVVFRPATLPPAVAAVKFVNSQVIPAGTLQRAMAGVAVGTPFTEKRLRGLLDTAIRPLYEARGRIRVAFPEVRSEPAADVKGVLVTVSVQEGASYDLGAVRIVGGHLPEKELLEAANLKPGDLFNIEDIQAGIARVEKRVRRDGYMRVKSSSERAIDDKQKKVDLIVRLEPGPRYTFGKLQFAGLDLHAEAALRRLWTLKEGEPFNADYPDYFLTRIREDAVFEELGKTKAELKADDTARTVDVTLHFSPVPPPKPEPKPW